MYSESKAVRVLHVVYDLGPGGMENGVVNICNSLASSGIVSTICTLRSGGRLEGRLDSEFSKLVPLNRRFGNDPFVVYRLWRAIRRTRADVVHSHAWPTLLEGYLATRPCRNVKWIHGEHGKIMTEPRQIRAQRWCWAKADALLSVSSALADRMSNEILYPRERITVISNGVDTSKFRPDSADRRDCRAKFGLSADAFVLGVIARLVDFKDHERLLAAVSELRKTGRIVHVALAGDGPLRDHLVSLAKEQQIDPQVHFLGVIDNVDQLLQGLDLLVSTSSHNEGMSNSVLEAMSSGVPVIATDVAASAELLEGGKAGILIPPKCTDSLVSAIADLHDNPSKRKSLASVVRRRIVEHYDIEGMMKAYQSLYRRLSVSHL